jgi:trk system potassium uptake protein TrkH
MTIFLIIGKKISLSSRMLIGDTFNIDSLQGVVQFLKRAFVDSFIVEGIGAVCFLPVFVPEYGVIKGIWYSVFHSVSAFCNAGIDILGENSFMPYVNNVWVNLVTMTLIILGGIGFIVWWDVLYVIRRRFSHDTKNSTGWHSLSLHTKIALSMTLILIFAGALLYLIFEYHNDLTIGSFSFPQKVLAACFQSVTTRTAGFASIPQKGLTAPSVILSIILMFIGGSSSGTAGGIKTTTLAVILITVYSVVRGESDITAFHRRIPQQTVRKAVAVISISLAFSLAALFTFFMVEDGSAADIAFEVFSAIGTAGLSRDYTSSIHLAGKIILCICMFLGRIGPISMVIAFTMKSTKSAVRPPEDFISVG